jgi:Leucine-rich repeat (LRR) protein
MASLLAKLMPKRRWMQLSLRTVLVLVTLLCVALSMWVVPAERQRRAVAAIETLGGRVFYADTQELYVNNQETNESFAKAFLRRWLPPDYFDAVEGVDLNRTSVMNAELAHLQGLRTLQALWLANPQVTDAGVVHLQGLTNLQVLYLPNTRVTNAGLAHLRGLTSLQELSLANTKLTDAGLANLKGLTSLQKLQLVGTHVTDAGLVHLRGLTSLRDLYLSHTQVTDAGVAGLRKALPNCRITGPGNAF